MFPQFLRELFQGRLAGLTRRDLLTAAGVAAAASQAGGLQPASSATTGLRIGPDMFESIGVRPLINCKGTFTIVSGSQSLPEVKQAMMEA